PRPHGAGRARPPGPQVRGRVLRLSSGPERAVTTPWARHGHAIDMNDIRERVRKQVIALSGARELGDHDDIFERGLLGSMFALRLVQAIEREFGVTVADGDLSVANFRSVDAMARLLARMLEAA